MHECMRSDACIAEREAEPEIACMSACSVMNACVHHESLTNTCNREVYEHATAATERCMSMQQLQERGVWECNSCNRGACIRNP